MDVGNARSESTPVFFCLRSDSKMISITLSHSYFLTSLFWLCFMLTDLGTTECYFLLSAR